MTRLLGQARHGLLAAAGTLADLPLSIARVKILALFLGPVGLGQLALVNNLIEVGANFAGIGVAGALNRELPRAESEAAEHELVSAGLLLSAGLLAVVLPITVTIFALQLGVGPALALGAVLFAAATIAAAYSRCLGGAFYGWRLSRAQFGVLAVGGALNLALVWTLLAAGITDVLLLALVVPLVQVAVTLLFIRRRLRAAWSLQRARLRPVQRKIMRIAGPIILAAMVEPVAFYYLRSVTEVRLGEVALGLIQPGLQLFILGRTLFASFAGMTVVRWDQSSEAGFSRRQVLLLAAALGLPLVTVPLVFLLGPLWELVVRLLFSHEFLPAAAILPWFVGGIALQAGAFLLNQTFISKGHNLLALLARASLLLALAAALHGGFAGSLMKIGQAFLLAQLGAFLVALAIWLGLQLRERAQAG